MAAKIASDQSTGTFVAVPGETEELKARVAARVVAIRPLPSTDVPSFGPVAGETGPFNVGEADIAFPAGRDRDGSFGADDHRHRRHLFDQGSVGPSHRRHEAAGGVSRRASAQFGLEGSRRLTGVRHRPIIGTIVKPALGLRPHKPPKSSAN